jgi:hypothetical protein
MLLVIVSAALPVACLVSLDGLSSGGPADSDAATEVGPAEHQGDAASDAGEGGADGGDTLCGNCPCTPSKPSFELVGGARDNGSFINLSMDSTNTGGALAAPSTAAGIPRVFVSFEASFTTASLNNAGDGLGVGWLSSGIPATCAPNTGSALCVFAGSSGAAMVLRQYDPGSLSLPANTSELGVLDAMLVSGSSPLAANVALVSSADVLTSVPDASADPPPSSWHTLEVTFDADTQKVSATLDHATKVTMTTPFTVPAGATLVIGAATGDATERVAIRNVAISVLAPGCDP